MKERLLSPQEVIEEYPQMTTSVGTLANWRSHRRGPKYYIANRRIVYKQTDIESYLFRNPVLTIDCVALDSSVA